MNIQVYPDAEAMADAAVEIVVKAAEAALANNNFRIAFSGGGTPRRTYELLAQAPIYWPRVEVFWVDERFVPNTDPNSNEKLVRDSLLSKVAVPAEQIHPMISRDSADECAKAYENVLTSNPKSKIQNPNLADLAIMGIGPDGHTASLFPGVPGLQEQHRFVVPTISPAGVPQRITLTIPALRQIGQLLFLVEGEGKREAFRKIRDRDSPSLPGAVVDDANPNCLWLITADVLA